MKKERSSRDAIIEGAIIGGAVGAVLGAILTGESQRTVTAMLVGAAIGATIKAKQEASEFKLTRLIETDGKIYSISPNGKKKLVRSITRSRISVPETFTIE